MQLVHIFSGQTMDAKLWPCVTVRRGKLEKEKNIPCPSFVYVLKMTYKRFTCPGVCVKNILYL